MTDNSWWKSSLRVIQTNLQVKDTPKMDPEKIAADMQDMGANVLVMNVGGIYAWYPTAIPSQTVNPYLPQDGDLLKTLIGACHRRGIRLVARYDFSKASDRVYQLHPQWFSRDAQNRPQVIGALRPGEWDLLYSTCINGAYRNDVAEEILAESLNKYEIDGVFFNAPHATNCHCSRCREKYREVYGADLPDREADWAPDWKSRCLADNIARLRKTIQAVPRDMPVILYYSIASDRLEDRLATCDMICTEAQDVLSLGWRDIPQSCKPALCVRLGASEPDRPKPFGIIHSCPCMDWRHTGLPPAEYMYWMSQVPANGGQIWHSITGFPDTISDKRLLRCVSEINHRIMRVEEAMEGAVSNAPAALIWDMHAGSMASAFGGQLNVPAAGWAEAMLDQQIPFDVLLPEQLSDRDLTRYRVLVLSSLHAVRDQMPLIETYVKGGGTVLCEAEDAPSPDVCRFLGIRPDTQKSEEMQASYLRLADDGAVRTGLEDTPLLPFAGSVLYAAPEKETAVWATLVPPFAPPEAVGAPPERASILTPRTDLPLLLQYPLGKGCVVSFLCSMTQMILKWKIPDHSTLVGNVLRYMAGDRLDVFLAPRRGIQLMDYTAPGRRLLHVVNGIGQRPLSENTPVQLTIRVKIGNRKVKAVRKLIQDETAKYSVDQGVLCIETGPVAVWEVFQIDETE